MLDHAPRAVVIGYGFAGRGFHSYLIGLDSGLTLHGVASRSPETQQRIAKERGCKVYDSFERVLDDKDVDLVVLATPNHMHTDLAVRALTAGKHVVTDKVMALNLAECDRMIAAARSSQRLLSVFQNRRWDGDYLTVRKLIGAGKLGAVRRLEMAWTGFGMWGGWRGTRAAGGGKLYDLGAHLADQICQLMPGRITSVFARLQYDDPRFDVESDALVVAGFEDGATAVLETSSICAISKPRFYVAGSGGTFVKHGLDPQEAAMLRGEIDAAHEDPAQAGRYHDGKTEAVVPTEAGRWRSYYENIAAALTRGEPLAVTPDSVRRGIALLEAAFQSARSGAEVHTSI
jgi:scyllo-inositol 2-dehydrogenase (NADP+)